MASVPNMRPAAATPAGEASAAPEAEKGDLFARILSLAPVAAPGVEARVAGEVSASPASDEKSGTDGENDAKSIDTIDLALPVSPTDLIPLVAAQAATPVVANPLVATQAAPTIANPPVTAQLETRVVANPPQTAQAAARVVANPLVAAQAAPAVANPPVAAQPGTPVVANPLVAAEAATRVVANPLATAQAASPVANPLVGAQAATRAVANPATVGAALPAGRPAASIDSDRAAADAAVAASGNAARTAPDILAPKSVARDTASPVADSTAPAENSIATRDGAIETTSVVQALKSGTRQFLGRPVDGPRTNAKTETTVVPVSPVTTPPSARPIEAANQVAIAAHAPDPKGAAQRDAPPAIAITKLADAPAATPAITAVQSVEAQQLPESPAATKIANAKPKAIDVAEAAIPVVDAEDAPVVRKGARSQVSTSFSARAMPTAMPTATPPAAAPAFEPVDAAPDAGEANNQPPLRLDVPTIATVQRLDASPTPFVAQPGQPASVAQAEPARPPESAGPAVERELNLVRDSAWLDQLAHDIARTAEGDGPMRFRLHPQTLGHLKVELVQADQGTTVRFTAETEAARAIIADAQPRLMAEARAQGVRIAESHVDLAGSGHDASRDPRRQDTDRAEPRIRTAGAAAVQTEIPDEAHRARTDRFA